MPQSAGETLECPITLEPIQAPVSTPCEHTFEKEALEVWLLENKVCPCCRKPLALTDLIDLGVREAEELPLVGERVEAVVHPDVDRYHWVYRNTLLGEKGRLDRGIKQAEIGFSVMMGCWVVSGMPTVISGMGILITFFPGIFPKVQTFFTSLFAGASLSSVFQATPVVTVIYLTFAVGLVLSLGAIAGLQGFQARGNACSRKKRFITEARERGSKDMPSSETCKVMLKK